jgi:hypothetical protein
LSDGGSRLVPIKLPDFGCGPAKNKTLRFLMKTGFSKRLIIGPLFLQVL